MPITVGQFYRKYERLLRAGRLKLTDIGCPGRRVPGDRRADAADGFDGVRGLVLLEPDESDVLVTVRRVDAAIALARCDRCKARYRVLLCDALPARRTGSL